MVCHAFCTPVRPLRLVSTWHASASTISFTSSLIFPRNDGNPIDKESIIPNRNSKPRHQLNDTILNWFSKQECWTMYRRVSNLSWPYFEHLLRIWHSKLRIKGCRHAQIEYVETFGSNELAWGQARGVCVGQYPRMDSPQVIWDTSCNWSQNWTSYYVTWVVPIIFCS